MSDEDRRATGNRGWSADVNGGKDSSGKGEWEVTPEMSGQPVERPDLPPVVAQVRSAGGSGHRSHARRPLAPDVHTASSAVGVPDVSPPVHHDRAVAPDVSPLSSGGGDDGMPDYELRMIRGLKIVFTVLFLVMLLPVVMDVFDQLKTGSISNALGSILVVVCLSVVFCFGFATLSSRREN